MTRDWRCRIGWHNWKWFRGPLGLYRMCVRTPSHT